MPRHEPDPRFRICWNVDYTEIQVLGVINGTFSLSWPQITKQARSTYKTPFITSSRSTERGRPPGLAARSMGAGTSHCLLVRPLGYGLRFIHTIIRIWKHLLRACLQSIPRRFHHLQAGIELSAVLPEAAALHHPCFGITPRKKPLPPRLPAGSAPPWARCHPPSTSTFCTWLRLARRRSNIAKAPARSVTLAVVNRMGQPLSVHGDVAPIPDTFLPESPCSGEQSVLSDHCFAGPRQPIFFKSLFTISSGSTAKARTTICSGIELSLAVLQRRRHFSSQPKDHSNPFRRTTSSLRFTTGRGCQQALHRRGKGFPGVSPIHQHILHLAQVGPAPVKHSQSPSTVRWRVNRMGQPLSVHGDVACTFLES